MGGDTKKLIMETVFPLAGTILSNAFYLVTGKEILKARREQRLGINPLPFPFATACTCIWVTYGVMLRNLWVIAGNFVPMLFNFFAVFVSYGLSDVKTQELLQYVITSLASILGFTGIALTFAKSHAQAISLWGLMGDVITCALLLSPVITVREIVRTKDASIIYLPLGLATLCNSFCWFSYGAALRDPYIAVPNVLGILMAALQILLKLRYGNGRRTSRTESQLATTTATAPSPAPAPPPEESTKLLAPSTLPSESTALEITPLEPPRPAVPPPPSTPSAPKYVSPSAPYLCARPPTFVHPFFRVFYERTQTDPSRILKRLDTLCAKISDPAVRARLAANKPLYFIVRDPTDYIEFSPLASCASFDGRSFLESATEAGMVAFADNPPAQIPGFFSTRLISCDHGYREEDICVHEFLHSIHQSGLTDAQCEDLERLYNKYNVTSIDYETKDTYAFTSSAEFFAEMGQIYLMCTARRDVTGGITWSKLRDQLPDMCTFLSSIFTRDEELYKLGCYCQNCFYYRPLPE